MHEKKIQKFVEQIQVIAKELKQQNLEDTSGVEPPYTAIGDGHYVIHGELLEKHRQLVEAVTASCENKCSEKYTENVIDDIIVSQVKRKNVRKATESIEKLLTDCGVTHRVYVPLAGVDVVDSLKIGNVRLVNTKRALKEIISALKRTAEARKDGQQLLDLEIPILEKEFSRGGCAVLEGVVAEHGKAREIAMEECAFIVDVLKFSSYPIYDRRSRVPHGIAIQSQHTWPIMTSFVISSDGHFSSSHSVVGQIRPFELSKGNIRIIRELGIIKFAQRRARNTLTDLDEQVRRSIHWFAESQAQDSEENELLSLVVCMEMFLTPAGQNESISGSIADGAAILLRKGIENRCDLRKDIKKAYRVRSSITHGETSKVKVSMPDLRKNVFDLILLMMQNPKKWTSVNSVQDYLTESKLA